MFICSSLTTLVKYQQKGNISYIPINVFFNKILGFPWSRSRSRVPGTDPIESRGPVDPENPGKSHPYTQYQYQYLWISLRRVSFCKFRENFAVSVKVCNCIVLVGVKVLTPTSTTQTLTLTIIISRIFDKNILHKYRFLFQPTHGHNTFILFCPCLLHRPVD